MNRFIAAGALVAVCLSLNPLSSSAQAQYPSRPVKLVVPYAPGGSVDAFARVVAPAMEARLGQSVIIENIAGAGGTIGVTRVVKSAPDGYTILMGIVSDVVLAPLTENTAAYTYQDLDPIAPLGTSGVGVVAHPSLKINSLSGLIAHARANPGKLSYGATGAGSLPALAMEALKQRAKVDLNFITYASASKIAMDVMGGHVDIAISGLPALLEHIKAGKMTAVGVMSKERDIGAPEIPSTDDAPELKGLDFYFWTGLFAPKGTPAPIVAKVNSAFTEVMKDEKVRRRFAEFGVKISDPMSPRDFGAYVANSNAQWQAVVKQVNFTKPN